uniref:Uncharacterized protein n=1 Tax=Rheinheimera sp. BAL341 TaxID=1708203 RepID=A0A486XUT2_9GAMM
MEVNHNLRQQSMNTLHLRKDIAVFTKCGAGFGLLLLINPNVV